MVSNLQIQKVDKKYGEIKALDSVSLNIDSGKVVALVGVNGSGKTTLLRILAGLDKLDRGNILFNNRRLSMPELRKISTLVFQKIVMFDIKVCDNVKFGLNVRGFAKEETEKRVEEALISVGLNGFQNRRAKKLSGGEQQRIALARAFVIEPKILLLDEPTANIDPSNAIIIEDAIRKMREKNSCIVVLATHNLHQARRLSDEIVHIHSGRILEIASPEEFFRNPINKITKKFVNGELQF